MPPAVANRSSVRKRVRPEAASGGLRLVGRGWAERRRVKVEREGRPDLEPSERSGQVGPGGR